MIDAPTAARAAALWWAEAIGAPTFRTVTDDYPADEQEVAAFGASLAGAAAARHPVSAEAAARFVDALAQIINERSHHYMGGLHTDYGPDSALAGAADEAGVHYTRFPYKTNMWIKDDHVCVSAGYGAQVVLVWQAPGWVRPPCGSQRYEGDDPRDEVCGLPKYHEERCADWRPDPKRCAACGGTYSEHYTGEYWQDPDRCHWRDQ